MFCSVTVGVSHFEQSAFWVQVLYYPFHGNGDPADYEENSEEDQHIVRPTIIHGIALGEPVVLRCHPYRIPLTELTLPYKISPVEYFRLWPSLPAVVESTGTYIYEGSGFKATAAQQHGESPFLSGLKSLSSRSFHKVCSHVIRTVAGFQVDTTIAFLFYLFALFGDVNILTIALRVEKFVWHQILCSDFFFLCYHVESKYTMPTCRVYVPR